MSTKNIIEDQKQKYIVTSALPYVNGIKHLGNLIGSILPADVYTRYLKAQGHDVIYACATDDHGTAIELAAIEEGIPVEEYVKKYHAIQEKIYKEFGIEFEIFGNTSDQANHEISQHLFLKLYEHGLIEEKETIQLYSIDDKRFLPDRFVRGTCPYCKYENARGDQCENCTKVLDPKDLINPRSAISGSTNVELRSSKHLFINLPKVQNKIAAWVESRKNRWPKTTYGIAKKWLNEGLQSRSITRDLTWGIPVPLKGYEEKRLYVWFDAPNGYISATIQYAKLKNDPKLWLRYWKDPNTRLIQFMGKDNVPFHTVTWPATILGADDGFILADFVKGFEWLNYEGEKFSTSLKRGVFLDQALAELPADYWRYYLLLIAPERHDTDFTWDGFHQAVNNDLANTLGNFVHRTLTFIHREFSSTIPNIKTPDEQDKTILAKVSETRTLMVQHFEQVEFQKALAALRQLWSDCNTYLQEKEPWRTIKNTPDVAATTLAISTYLCYACAILSFPFIPATSKKIFGLLGFSENLQTTDFYWSNVENFEEKLQQRQLPADPKPLFRKIDDKEIERLKTKYRGKSDAEISPLEVKGGQKKSKEKKQAGETKERPNIPEGLVTIDEFKKVRIVVGKVLTGEKLATSKKLLKLSIDIGEHSPRQILSGIAEFYQPEDLVGKHVLVMTNLVPKKIQGLESQGMILAVDVDEKHFQVVFVDTSLPVGAQLG